MFAFILRKEIAIRMLVIAVILLNAVVPSINVSASSTNDLQENAVEFPGLLHARAMVENTSTNNSGLYQIQNCQIGGDLVIADGETCSLDASITPYTYNSLNIQSGGALHILGNTSSNVGVTINGDNVNIEAGGKITAYGTGFVGNTSYGTGPGAGHNSSDYGGGGGGSHGGLGNQSSSNATAPTYGDISSPTALGSSGGVGISFLGGRRAGGTGGGAIHFIVSGTLTVNGEISADGKPGTDTGEYFSGGGGSGGSIWIETNNLTGSGFIHANGGTGGGDGGGGRIAVYYTSTTYPLDGQHIHANGNNNAGPGTVYLKDENTGFEKLLIDNSGKTTTLYATLPTGSYSYDEIELTNNGSLRVLGSTSSLTISNQSINGDSTGRLEVEGVLHGPQDLSLTNVTLSILGDFKVDKTL